MYLNTPTFIRYQQSKLPSNFWDYTLGLTPNKKLLLAYLYTNLYSNRLGCFYYPFDNIVRDLEYDYDEAITDLYVLEKNAFVSSDALSEWIYLPHYLTYFPIRNPNQGKHIENLFYDVPWECSFYSDLVLRLLCVDHLSKSFRNHLKQELYKSIRKQIKRGR
jgi:hypothetical protein